MASSYRWINYSLRPAKVAQRKMLCDLFRRLEPFGRPENYRYVGLGSIYFTDFLLFHQSIGICDMLSIEKDTSNWSRFEFNLPFRCIDLKPGHSNNVLPTLPWDKQSIVWMDYDAKLDKSVLADIATFSTRACSGSILIVTINVEPERKLGASPQDETAFRRSAFANAIGDEKVPHDLSGSDLRGTAFARTCRRVVLDEITTCLADRNAPLPSDDKIHFQQVIQFSYADDAAMLTLGGLLLASRDNPLLEQCAFRDLSFYRDGEIPCEIRAPRFTPKELRHLNSMLPPKMGEHPELPGIPEGDVQDYAAIYRYYPSFGEIILG